MKIPPLLFVLIAAPITLLAADQRVVNAPNIEDMLTTPDGKWVIGSGMAVANSQPGGLYAINIASKSLVRLYPLEATNAHSNVQPVGSSCPGELSPGDFAPHGISLQQTPDGSWSLYVVNHGGRESVERFSLAMGKEAEQPVVTWQDCIVLPPGTSANSVAVATDGAVYITAAGDAFMTASAGKNDTLQVHSDIPFPPGGILAWSSTLGWREIPSANISQPNGLLLSEDNQHLYAADWTGKAVLHIDLQNSQASRSLLLDFMPDNLRWDSNGYFWAAGHTAAPKSVVECYISTASECSLDWALARIDSQAMVSDCQQLVPATETPGEITVSGITVALPVADTLWLGTFRGTAINIRNTARPIQEKSCIQP